MKMSIYETMTGAEIAAVIESAARRKQEESSIWLRPHLPDLDAIELVLKENRALADAYYRLPNVMAVIEPDDFDDCV
jgi:hypothetical protein